MSDESQDNEPWEATQVQTQTQRQEQGQESHAESSSQSAPWLKYWAIFVPMHSSLSLIKIPWAVEDWRMGRRPNNNTVLAEKRISSFHCKIELGETQNEGEPVVFIEDLKSSNGTFVNSHRLPDGGRRVLVHGDEISLGSSAVSGIPDVRWIFRAVGKAGKNLPEVGTIFKTYALLESLGAGTFAEVKKAMNFESGQLYACKIIKKHKFANSATTLNLFKREIEILQTLEHEYICKYVNHYDDPGHIYVILEYVDGGDLLGYINGFSVLRDGQPISASLPEEHAADLALMLCQAIAYIHDKHITHRDLKPENILLTKPDANGKILVKVADFGLAKMVHSGTFLKSMVGTPQYIAPEVVMQTPEREGYEDVVDSWSVGVVVYTMLTKMLPFDDDNAISVADQIRARFYLEYASCSLRNIGASDVAIDFISRLLERDPEERMTMRDALNHPWLRDRHLADGGVASQRQRQLSHAASFSSDISIDTDDCMTPTPERMQLQDAQQEEDFSQPLRDLRLNTPRVAESAQLAFGSSFFSGGPSNSVIEDSDPQSAFYIANTKAAAVKISTPSKPELGDMVSPPPSVKRKITAIYTGAPVANFSSGELSPPPPEPVAGPSSALMTMDEASTPAVQPKGKGRVKRVSDINTSAPRSSPRLSALSSKKPRTESDDSSSPTTSISRNSRSRR